MYQLTQDLEKGRMKLLEVPLPRVGPDTVLVRTLYSVISPGTEGKTVRDARAGYLTKARSRKDEVKKVIRAMKDKGVRDTVRMVKDRLEAPSPLGYSCVGEVLSVGGRVNGIRKGDLVACGGTNANHAEVVAVPRMLCVSLPENTPLESSAFTTIGAIAMQGIRQAEVDLGGNAVVIGLGPLGILTCKLLEAGGIDAIGIDIDPSQVELARKAGVKDAYTRNYQGLDALIEERTFQQGTDAVIITAATSSLDPVEFAGTICRQKGKVVMVGNAPTGFSRKNYYKKELDLRMSCSYGPGRYDPEYEEKGKDYPIGYARWTENRNMKAFVSLLSQGKLNISTLITHRFSFSNAPEAYSRILDKEEAFGGVVLEYDRKVPELLSSIQTRSQKQHSGTDRVGIGLIGGGSFARNILLPAMKGKGEFVHVATSKPQQARHIADKYGFVKCSGDAGEVIEDPDVNTIFILTRHDSHADLVIRGLKAGKNVFVEKPLTLDQKDLQEVDEAYKNSNGILMVGFNRRFAPFAQQVMKKLDPETPRSINIRVNAGILPSDHWVHDPTTGGGRIIGEACHFLDLAAFLGGAPIKSLSANGLPSRDTPEDTITVTLELQNKSIANISYFSNGSAKLSKERIEIFQKGGSYLIDDFKEMNIYSDSSKTKKIKQDKGHNNEVDAFLNGIRNGRMPIDYSSLLNSSSAPFAVIESIKNGGIRLNTTDHIEWKPPERKGPE